MSATYGYLEGNRGTVTRCGSRDSGITARLKTWKTAANCHLSADDVLTISTSVLGGNNKMKIIVDGKEV